MAAFSNLGKDEQTLLQAKVHWISLLPRGIVAAICLIAGVAVAGIGGALVGLVLGAATLLPALIPMSTVQLVITSKKAYGKAGVGN